MGTSPGGRQEAAARCAIAIPGLQGRFSADCRWIAYTSTESGRPEVYVLAFPTASQRIQISTAGATRPRWRADGRELFFVGGTGADTHMMAVDIDVAADGVLTAGLPRELFNTSIFGIYHVAPDGSRFLVNVPSQRVTSVTPPLTVVANWQ